MNLFPFWHPRIQFVLSPSPSDFFSSPPSSSLCRCRYRLRALITIFKSSCILMIEGVKTSVWNLKLSSFFSATCISIQSSPWKHLRSTIDSSELTSVMWIGCPFCSLRKLGRCWKWKSFVWRKIEISFWFDCEVFQSRVKADKVLIYWWKKEKLVRNVKNNILEVLWNEISRKMDSLIYIFFNLDCTISDCVILYFTSPFLSFPFFF